MRVKYFGGTREVRLGDRVSLMLWFRKRYGRVVYVPDVSPFDPEFEYNDTRWVGIRLEDRSLVASPVLADSERLKSKVHFIGRASEGLITATLSEFEQGGESVEL